MARIRPGRQGLRAAVLVEAPDQDGVGAEGARGRELLVRVGAPEAARPAIRRDARGRREPRAEQRQHAARAGEVRGEAGEGGVARRRGVARLLLELRVDAREVAPQALVGLGEELGFEVGGEPWHGWLDGWVDG